MTLRKSVFVGVGLFAAAWIVPGPIMMGLIYVMRDSGDGSAFLGGLVLPMMLALWLQGTMIAAAFLLPLATWIQSLSPGSRARRIVTVGVIVGLLLLTAPFLYRFLTLIAYLLVTAAWLAVPMLAIVACVFIAGVLRRCGQSGARAWGGSVATVVMVTIFLVADARQAPANVWGPNPEAHPTKGIVAPALHWILEHTEKQGNSPWAPSDVQKSYGAQMSLTASIVEAGPKLCRIEGTLTNRGEAVVRNAIVRVEITDAQNRPIGTWSDDVVAFEPVRPDNDGMPLRPGESRGFEGTIPVPAVLWRHGPATPLQITAKASGFMVEKIPGSR